MKLKYYLRGLGIGIIITTIILMIAHSGYRKEMTDEEIIARAEALGMIMKEDPLFSNSETNKDSELSAEKDSEHVTENESIEVESVTESEAESEVIQETETEVESETEAVPESETETETEIVATGDTYHLVIPSGSVPRLICNELEENGVVESAASLRQYLVDVGYATSIKVGAYDIPYGATNEEVYQILKAGPL